MQGRLVAAVPGAFALVAMMTTACSGIGTTPTRPLDPAFGKAWTGMPTMRCEGIGLSTYPEATLRPAVAGNSMNVELGCLGGSQLPFTLTGSGRTATWAGVAPCPPAGFGPCDSWVFTRTALKFVLTAEDTLTVSAVGTLQGCGNKYACTGEFLGRSGP